MVKTIKQNQQIVFTCKECGMKYHDEETAKKCEALQEKRMRFLMQSMFTLLCQKLYKRLFIALSNH